MHVRIRETPRTVPRIIAVLAVGLLHAIKREGENSDLADFYHPAARQYQGPLQYRRIKSFES